MNTGGLDNLVRQTANRFGFDIRRYHPETSDMGRLSLMLANRKIDLVFDIGANNGQFAKSLRRAGYTKRLVSFEPLSIAHAQLLQTSRGDSNWEIAPRGAIGDHDGEIEMHIAGNSVSSSALQMLDDHATAAPDSAYVGNERVRVTRLDASASSYIRPETRLFIKIDTQGYEDRVLDGAVNVLNNAVGLQLELSLIPLYQGQKLFDALAERMRKMGYSIWAICPGFCDPRTGRMLQVDATFFRD